MWRKMNELKETALLNKREIKAQQKQLSKKDHLISEQNRDINNARYANFQYVKQMRKDIKQVNVLHRKLDEQTQVID